MAKAPIDIRSLARSHCVEAINILAGIMRSTPKPADRINAADVLLKRGYGAPVADADAREHINITIRKILEGGSVTIVETQTTQEPLVIEHNEGEMK